MGRIRPYDRALANGPKPEYAAVRSPLPGGIPRLIQVSERLRDLDEWGYQTSRDRPMSTWLVHIEGWNRGRSQGRGTSCSPFTCQAIAMAYSQGDTEPYRPVMGDGRPLPSSFSAAHNGRGNDSYSKGAAHSIVAYNLGVAVPPTQMRRGDVVAMHWANGGGHAAFCWDVHLDRNGEVDCFQVFSSNGQILRGPNREITGGVGCGISIMGNAARFIEMTGEGSGQRTRKKSGFNPHFRDRDEYVEYCTWYTWKNKREIDTSTFRVRPRNINDTQLSSCSVARFHGVTPPEPYCMGAAPYQPQFQGVQPTEVNRGDLIERPEEVRQQTEQRAAQLPDTATMGQLAIEQRLKVLWRLGMIGVDPGNPDNTMDDQTRAAIRDFQERNGLTVDGIPGRRTKEKLREKINEARNHPRFQDALRGDLAPGGSGGSGGAGGSPSQAGGGGGPAPTQAGGAPAQTDGASPGQASPGQAAPAAPVEPRVIALYWRTGAARPNDSVALQLRAVGMEGVRFEVRLKNAETNQEMEPRFTLDVRGGKGTVTVRIPVIAGASPGQSTSTSQTTSQTTAQAGGGGGARGDAAVPLVAVARGTAGGRPIEQATEAPVYVAR